MKEEREVTENLEEVVEDITDITMKAEEAVNEVQKEVLIETKKTKKHDEAVALVDEAKIIVKKAEEQLKECKLLLSDDLKDYEEAKVALRKGGLDESEALLSELGYIDNSEETIEEESVVFEPKEDLEPIILQDVSSGKFTGFLLSLLGGVGMFAGLVYLATEKLGLTLDVTKVPTSDTMTTVLGWFTTLFGAVADTFLGGAFLLFVVLAVMGIIYMIRVSTRGSKNLHFATKQLEEAEEYSAYKGNCKDEMDRVDVHIHDAISTLKTYQVLLNEQKGKLVRILHIEGEKEAFSGYHEKSILEMRDTQILINSIQRFMATSMSEEGKLSGKSTLFLDSAKSKMQKVIERLY